MSVQFYTWPMTWMMIDRVVRTFVHKFLLQCDPKIHVCVCLYIYFNLHIHTNAHKTLIYGIQCWLTEWLTDNLDFKAELAINRSTDVIWWCVCVCVHVSYCTFGIKLLLKRREEQDEKLTAHIVKNQMTFCKIISILCQWISIRCNAKVLL